MLALLVLLTAPLVQAQEKPPPADAPQAAAQSQVHLVTVIVREKSNNIPAKFSGSLDLQRGHLVMPLFDEALPEWIAEISTRFAGPGKEARFALAIADVSRLEARSTQSTPFAAYPVTVLEVELPLEIGAEISIYKSPTFSLAILFEEGS